MQNEMIIIAMVIVATIYCMLLSVTQVNTFSQIYVILPDEVSLIPNLLTTKGRLKE